MIFLRSWITSFAQKIEYAWAHSEGFRALFQKGYFLLPALLVLCFFFLVHTLLLISERCDGTVRESLRPTGAKVWRWVDICAGTALLYLLLLQFCGLLPLLTAAEVGQLVLLLALMLLPVIVAGIIYRKPTTVHWPLVSVGGLSMVALFAAVGYFGEIYSHLYPNKQSEVALQLDRGSPFADAGKAGISESE